jgi:hypothetical protein
MLKVGPRHTLIVAATLLLSLQACSKDNPSRPKPNHPPQIASQADTTCAPGDTIRLRAIATDEDDDALVFSIAVLLTWQELRDGYDPDGGFDPSTGDFWFRPGTQDVPRRGFTFFVEDEHGSRDSTEFSVWTFRGTSPVRTRPAP